MQIVNYFPSIILALNLVAAGSAAAQAFYYVSAPKGAVAKTASPSYIARVVDARPQQASLVLTIRGKKELAAMFHEGMASTLQTFFTTYAPGQPGAVQLVLRVSGPKIGELIGSVIEGRVGQSATAGLVAGFYPPQPNSS